MIKMGFFKSPDFFESTIHSRFKVLHSVWYARIVRRTVSLLIRTPLKEKILKLVTVNISIADKEGCIITMCRTPWKRLLDQWCLKENFGLVITGKPYNDNRRIIHRKGCGVSELRGLVNHLKAGGRVVAITDIFNDSDNCQIRFMGHQQNISLFVERLAALANVPILVSIPRLMDKSFNFIPGPKFLTNDIKPKKAILTRQVISYLENEIRNNPSIWANYVK